MGSRASRARKSGKWKEEMGNGKWEVERRASRVQSAISNQQSTDVLGSRFGRQLGTGKVESGKWKVKSIRLDNSSCE